MVRKIIVNYGKDIDIDYVKYGEDTDYNYFICLDYYYMGSIQFIKIMKSCRKNYRYDEIEETEYMKK
jgi:hypothetical protein